MEPRGIRNNNPLNIEWSPSVRWQGLAPQPTDGRFCRFISMTYGLRAAFRVIRTYLAKPPRGHGLETLPQIIYRFAPQSENSTTNYIKIVTARSGISSMERLSFNNRDKMCRLLQAMAFVETGKIIDMQLIHTGYDLAIR